MLSIKRWILARNPITWIFVGIFVCILLLDAFYPSSPPNTSTSIPQVAGHGRGMSIEELEAEWVEQQADEYQRRMNQEQNSGMQMQIRELEDRMDYMAEQYQRDLDCIKSGSSFC